VQAGDHHPLAHASRKIKHEVVYDGLFLTSVVAMLQIMAASGHRGVRHTSTELGMETLSKLVELLVELDAQHDSKSRQQTGKKKQAGTMHAEMAQDIKDIEEKQAKLKDLMESIYQTIFLPRFRDTFLDIRLCCAHGFGRCVVLHKATYFDDQYLKYFGWMCNDSSPLAPRRSSSSWPSTSRPRTTSSPSRTSPGASSADSSSWPRTWKAASPRRPSS